MDSSQSKMSVALETINRILRFWNAETHRDIHKIGKSLQQLTTTFENIIDLEANAQAVLSRQRKDYFSHIMEKVTESWCNSYLDIERVLVSILKLYGITLNAWQDDGTGRSFNQRVLGMFDDHASPLNHLLGHRSGSAPVDDIFWSDTWKQALAEETAMTGRNLTRDSIDQLRMYKDWWPKSKTSIDPPPEFLGSKIAPPKNYEAWFKTILEDLVSAFEVCHKAKLETIDEAPAASMQALDTKSKGPSGPANENSASSTATRRVADSEISLPEHPGPKASTSLAASLPMSTSSTASRPMSREALRKEIATLKRDLQQTTVERNRARTDRSRLRQQRDEAQKELSDRNAKEDKRIMNAVENKNKEIWGQVRSVLASDQLFEFIRGTSRGDA
ncbi:hypothetical protein MMC29_001011 [Sticta canariensis]|nr:hypothetical protein [Sticta canariensis]